MKTKQMRGRRLLEIALTLQKSVVRVTVAALLSAVCLFGAVKARAQETAASTDASVVPHSPESLRSLESDSDARLEELINGLSSTPLIWPTNLPNGGVGITYWSLAHPDWPPLPTPSGTPFWDLTPSDPAASMSDSVISSGSTASTGSPGFYLLDDVDYPPVPGTNNDGSTNIYFPAGSPVFFDPGTNLWIAQEAVAGGNFTGILSNTIPGVEYQLLSMNFLDCTQWAYLGEPILATTNWIPWTLPFDPTTNFFLNALSLQDDGGGLPEWWQLKYFGMIGINPDSLDPAGDGWTDWQKFAMGVSPFAWANPPPPPNASGAYNILNNTVTLTWQPSPGNVTGYTITRIVPPYYFTTFPTLPATATNFVDNSPVTNFPPTQGLPFYYLQAIYSLGNSEIADVPMFNPGSTVSGQIVAGTSGENLTLTSPIPPGTSGFQLIQSYFDHNNLTYAQNFYNVPISDLNGNAATLPASWFQLATSDSVNEYWYVQSINTNGNVSSPSLADSESENNNLQSSPPLLDGRQQLAQNLSFLLRGANTQFPLGYSIVGGWYSYADYAFSGLYDETPTYAGESIGPYLDKFEPFEENYLYKNFVYSTTNVNQSGFLTTGLAEDTGGGDYLDPPLAYTFQPETTNDVINAVLDPTESQFITFYPETESDYNYIYGGYQNGPDQYLGLTGGSGSWAFSSPVTNCFGLPITSVLFAYNQNGTYKTSILSLNDSNTNISNGGLYWQATPPELQTTGYYFAQPWAEPLPGDPNFSVTNITSTGLIAGFGHMSVFAGYGEENVLNGTATPLAPYAYLGQYFEPQVYQVDESGNVTTNIAGTVSPYGELVATEPGPVALETMPNYGENVQGTGIVHVVKLVLDVNHDGVMDLSSTGPDNTTANTPYVFWENNNYDRYTLDADDSAFYDDDVEVDGCPYTPNTATPDCNYLNGSGQRVISCPRDLQDFARLWIAGMTTNLLAALPAGCTISLNWGDLQYPNPNNPTIDLFTAADADGGIGYLTNSDTAETQTEPWSCPYIGRLGPGSNLVLNTSSFTNNWAGNYFIWCGVSNGTGGLNLTVANSNGTVLAQTTAYIQIEDIKQMYERWTVGEQPSIAPTNNAVLSTEGLTSGETAFNYPLPENTNTPYILYVHGWNMEEWEKDRFAESAFKRLYWQGYQGRFGAFRWPTDYGFTGSFWQSLTQPDNYDNSEYQAYQSAQGLANKLDQLNTEYPGHVYVLAHSMGNVVTGTALELAAQEGMGQVANTYVASQGAISAHNYDASVTSPNLLPFTYEYPSGFLNTLGTNNYGPYAPDIYVNRLTNTVAAVGQRFNYYNTNDFALAMPRWGFDQILKPDHFVGGYYYYSGSINDPAPWNNFEFVFYSETPTTYFNIVTNLNDLYTVMSHGAPSYSTALGATPGITSFANMNLTTVWPPDTSGNNYTEHFYHSAEFRGDAWQEWNYWETLLYSAQFGFDINNQ